MPRLSGKLALALGPEIIEQIHARVVAIACEKRIVRGRRLRVDTTVVETDIHYPTDSSLLGDGVRVLTRTMQRIAKIAGRAGTKLRDRTRAVGYQVRQIARASRSRVVQQGQERLKACYRKLLYHTARVVGQARRFAEEVASGRKRARSVLKQIRLQANRAYLERMIPLVRQVMHQTRERLFKGNTHVPGKLVSLFEPHTEVIRKGKAAKPTEFGKMVKIQEAEAQIVTHYEVYGERPEDSDLLLPPSTCIASSWVARRIWLPPMPPSSRSTTRRPPAPAASSESPSPIAPPRARSVSGWRRNAGSATLRGGAPAARAASVFSSAATA